MSEIQTIGPLPMPNGGEVTLLVRGRKLVEMKCSGIEESEVPERMVEEIIESLNREGPS